MSKGQGRRTPTGRAGSTKGGARERRNASEAKLPSIRAPSSGRGRATRQPDRTGRGAPLRDSKIDGGETVTAIPGDMSKAFEILLRYPNLSGAIDRARFRQAVTKKYPQGPEMAKGEVFDLYTALLVSVVDGFTQEGHNQATPEGALYTIDEVMAELSFDQAARKSAGVKLSNLRTSSLWDTLAELLLAAHLTENMTGYTIALEYPLEPGKPVGRGKDADVALVGKTGELFLIDVVAPQPISKGTTVTAQLTEWIARKYESKFSAYCAVHPEARIGIVTALIKNEQFYMALPRKLVFGEVLRLESGVLDALPGLSVAHACSFRCPTGKRLVLDPIASYVRELAPPATATP